MSPLHVAAKSDRYKIVEYLVDEVAEISTKNSDGVSIYVNIHVNKIFLAD